MIILFKAGSFHHQETLCDGRTFTYVYVLEIVLEKTHQLDPPGVIGEG